MMKHLPNILTAGRIAAIPFIVIVYYLSWQYAHFAACFIFILASLTDWFDGYLARRLQVTSLLGALLDPIADKLLVATALIMIASQPEASITLPAIIIVCRELLISGLRAWMGEMGKSAAVAINQISKWKTAIQMLAIISLLCYPKVDFSLLGITSYVLIYIAAGLALWSMIDYLRVTWIAVKIDDIT